MDLYLYNLYNIFYTWYIILVKNLVFFFIIITSIARANPRRRLSFAIYSLGRALEKKNKMKSIQ